MPPTASDATPNTRPTCTGVAARFHAGSLAVCREGSIVALHVGTPEGTVIITMRERDFLRGARGSVDHHGHPFRTLEQLDAELSVVVPPPADEWTAAPARGRRASSAEIAEKNRKAWELYQSGAALSLAEAAKAAGASYVTFQQFVRYSHHDEARRLRRERWGAMRHRHKASPVSP